MTERLVSFAERVGARYWIGAPTPGDTLAHARAIAARLGYPSARAIGAGHDPVADLIPLDRPGAAHVLAIAAGSLAYGRYRPEPAIYALATAALAPFGDDATEASRVFRRQFGLGHAAISTDCLAA